MYVEPFVLLPQNNWGCWWWCNINILLLSYRAIKTTRGSRNINGDLLLFVQMRFIFFPSKKEAKEIVWGSV